MNYGQKRGAMSKDIIIIARHGKPALSRKVKLNWREYREWWKDYIEAALLPTHLASLKYVLKAGEPGRGLRGILVGRMVWKRIKRRASAQIICVMC